MVSYDIMHTAAGCVQNMLQLVKGSTFGESDATYEHTKNGRWIGTPLEKHPFIASKDGLKAARDWLIRAKECSGDALYDVNIDIIFSDSWKRCHDYCVFASPFGKGAFSLLGLGQEQKTTAYMYFDAISQLQRKWFTEADIEYAPRLMAEALSYLEQDFPFVLQDIKNHNLMHIAEALKESGPAWVAAMWSFERYNKLVADWAEKSPREPAGSVFHCALMHMVSAWFAVSDVDTMQEVATEDSHVLSHAGEYDGRVVPSYMSCVPGYGLRLRGGHTLTAQRSDLLLPLGGKPERPADGDIWELRYQVHQYVRALCPEYNAAWLRYLRAEVLPSLEGLSFNDQRAADSDGRLPYRKDAIGALKKWQHCDSDGLSSLDAAISQFYRRLKVTRYDLLKSNNVKFKCVLECQQCNRPSFICWCCSLHLA